MGSKWDIGECLWVESYQDVDFSGHETIYEAWEKIFRRPLDLSLSVTRKSLPNEYAYLLPCGFIALISWPGNDSIHRKEEK